ncbi:type IX secretion system sortase PorU [Flavobacterium terrae]|uniref:Peptidase family C25 n=1 Tax=Flavobacterium terrae TaxID=415425 RepID=A0A1M6G2R3_9FLAO|nr:type IX secretion system sortase PorU [Flavobacterium terrae]SHJ04127.1 Peptidase family C25 [Flavobacterium terrae]
MKKYFLITAIFFCLFSYAQERKTISIDWVTDGVYKHNQAFEFRIPNFKSEFFNFSDQNKTILFSQKFKSDNEIDENSLAVSNIVFESISSESLGELDKKLIKSSISPIIYNSKARDDNYVVFSFQPIIKQNGIYKRVKSLEYSFQYSSSSNFASKNIAALSSSVFKTGEWKRFFVEKSGVYKITKSFLASLGFNVNVDPRTIKIYGNGGRMVPLLNSEPYPIDIAENAIQFIGEEDGSFNDGDYILFYAEGIDNWNNDSQTHVNLYGDKSYYYVTSSSGNGKRIQSINEPTQAPNATYNSYDEYQFHEVDKVNVARLGRTWYGEQFNFESQQTFQFNFPNLQISNPISLKVRAAGASASNTSMDVSVNGQPAGTILFAAINPQGPVYGSPNLLTATVTTNSQNISVGLKYNNNGVPSSNAFLDYISITTKSDLKGFGKQFRFKVDEVDSQVGVCEYQINNASSVSQVWDITDIYNVTSKVNSGQALFTLKSNMGQAKRYIALDNNDFYAPGKEADSSVSNQDLKGTIFYDNQGQLKDVDYVIVTPSFLASQAERLANFHRTYSSLNVKVVTLDMLYKEFSSGKQDIGAIRNFVKYIYDNDPFVPGDRIKYVCLFGDASFDFKDRIKNNTNIVPIFHSLESFSLVSSFVSDDYFGLMNSNEGNMLSNQSLDVAVGRILASNLSQAEQMVTKIIDYHDLKSYGRWRNNIVFISDDVDKVSDATLEHNMDDLGDAIVSQKKFINLKKIHMDAYVQETTSGGQKYPKAREEMFNAFGQGALVFNYLGHGGEDGLSGERIFEISDAKTLANKYKYPLFITVTCEFTRFDNPLRPTGGKLVYQNPSGGSVAMVTTTRQIGQGTGETFNTSFGNYLFPVGDVYTSIAEAVRLTKVASSNMGNNVISYIGDPALMLAIPKPKVRLTKINDIPVVSSTESLQALSYVKLSGEVTDEFNNILTSYNGDVAVQIFDKDINRTTLVNDGIGSPMNFVTLGETIFRGNASVANGLFEFGFVVPRDIKIPVGNGKVSFYARRSSVLQDKTGYDTDIRIGGINTNAEVDITGPRVRIYMNDESFVSGGITDQSPLFLAFLEDEHGINTASGIGHDIIAYLDGDETKPYILNDYYETELNDYTKGKLKYPFRNLTPGLHTLTFKAWDVYNNLITAELQFIVVGDETLTITNVLNYPNPFVNHTEFWFTHNKPSEPLEVQVQVMTITGKIVWSKNEVVTTEGFTSRNITWDGRDDFGDKIGKGVYVYKLTVKSTLTNKKTEKFEKLVIL